MKRTSLYQLILVAAICFGAYLIISITQSNLAQLGVHSGFDFFWKRAGFEIGQALIPYDANSTISRAFVVALLNTLVLACASIVCATILGFVIGLARLSSNWLVARLATMYVEIFRNIPSLLQIFFWYFVVLRSLPHPHESLSFGNVLALNNHGLFLPLPQIADSLPWIAGSLLFAVAAAWVLYRWARAQAFETGRRFPAITTGIALMTGLPALVMIFCDVAWEVPRSGRFSYEGGLVLMPEFIALVVGLSIYNATYIAEIVRSGFSSVAAGQIEAANALGLPRRLTLRLILFPQAVRVIIPPLTTQYLNLFKGTSLAAAIGYPEIVSVFVGTVNNLVGQPVIIMFVTLITYSLISLCAALILNSYNRRFALAAE